MKISILTVGSRGDVHPYVVDHYATVRAEVV
jgi:hypothetical protein